MLPRRSILFALASLPALPVMAWAQSAEDIRKRVMATPVYPVETYVDYVRKSGAKAGFISILSEKFAKMDATQRAYFAYIANGAIESTPTPTPFHGIKIPILCEFFLRNPATAGDVETIKDFVERFPSSKDRFHDLADLWDPKPVGSGDTPLGVIFLWHGRVGGRKSRSLL